MSRPTDRRDTLLEADERKCKFLFFCGNCAVLVPDDHHDSKCPNCATRFRSGRDLCCGLFTNEDAIRMERV